MINNVYVTNPKYVKYLDCNSGSNRKIGFETCKISVIEGPNILQTISLCDFTLESLEGDENGGCGGSATRIVTLTSNGNYTLVAPEVGQEQGEVQMIAVKVKYKKNHPTEDRYLTWEYKGKIYPLGSMMFLTGRTKPNESWYGWDLSNYSYPPTSPDFSPQIFPPASSPDLSFGGILFSNPNMYDVELEIMIFN
jgi:hypothetical protein